MAYVIYLHRLLILIQVGDAALSILHSMASAHSDLDDAGEIVTPTPAVKFALSSPRCLPHVAQVNMHKCFFVFLVKFLVPISYMTFGRIDVNKGSNFGICEL